MYVPKVSVKFKETEDSVQIVFNSISNADDIFIRPTSSGNSIDMTGNSGDTISLKNANSIDVIAVKDGEETVVASYNVSNPQSEESFSVENRTDLTLDRVKQRYIEGETWLLDFEEELESVLD